MKGNSGASLEFAGEFVLKTCPDAKEQNDWFRAASNLPTVDGIKIPFSELVSETSYRVEFISGSCGTKLNSTLIIETLLDQVFLWGECSQVKNNSWEGYLERLYSLHLYPENSSKAMLLAFDEVSKLEGMESSFSHGDLTLENIIVSGKNEIAIIDPNFKQNLFQSYVLDLGKLLQSVNSNYHWVFNSNYGVDLTPHKSVLLSRIREAGLLRPALISEISHIMRIRKYQPPSRSVVVDDLLLRLLGEVKSV